MTLSLALLATAGRVVVPVAVQQTIDNGLSGPEPDLPLVRLACGLALLAVAVTAFANYLTNVRLYRTAENGLAALRVRAFRRVHDLSVLHQAAERRGSLVSRVTSDVDTMSTFMQWGGLLILVSAAQLTLATVLMLFWSWQLTLVVYLCFLPLVFAVRSFQRGCRGRTAPCACASARCSAPSPSRSSARRSSAPTACRPAPPSASTRAVDATRVAQTGAQRIAAVTFSAGEVTAAFATGAVIVVGVLLGVAGDITTGRLVGFLFLVTLFVQPVQIATEVLNEAQNALAGLRRVLGVLDTPSDVADPAEHGQVLPPGPVGVRFDHVGFAYPGGPDVLHDVDLELAPRTRVAVVGETGSGKTTFAKLLTRLMDPTRGRVLLSGVPLDEVRFDSLRSRVVMVPQDGFLFDDTVAANVRLGRTAATDADVERAFADLGLADWVSSAAGRCAHPRRRARRVAVGRRAAAGGDRPGVRRRPRRPRPRRGDQRRRPGDRGAAAARARLAHPRAARPSPSPTACRPPRAPTRCSSSTPAWSSSAARTPSWCSRTGSTRGCTRPGSPSPADGGAARAPRAAPGAVPGGRRLRRRARAVVALDRSADPPAGPAASSRLVRSRCGGSQAGEQHRPARARGADRRAAPPASWPRHRCRRRRVPT